MTSQRLARIAFVIAAALGSGGMVGCAATASGRATVATNPGQSGSGESGAVSAGPPARPATEEACKTCDGVWGVHGISQTPSCNCRTTDGGKVCRDGNDCQGMCIAAENPETQVVEAGPPARGYFLGRCSELVTVFGCNRLISRDTAKQGPVPLSEPPPMMCAD